jgi:hypothetical protein
MKTSLILTLLLILLAAVIAAAAIFFLLARSGPPGDPGAGSSTPPGALLYQGVTHFQVTVPMDGSAENRQVLVNVCRSLKDQGALVLTWWAKKPWRASSGTETGRNTMMP